MLAMILKLGYLWHRCPQVSGLSADTSSLSDTSKVKVQRHNFYSPATVLIALATIIHFGPLIPGAFGQQLVNGQFFTAGLAISNAPAPNSEFTVGGNIPVSIEVSGNGRLSLTPGSTAPTALLSLDIFLISLQNNVNLTVSSGPQLLQGEPGSTVKHLNWAIPECLPGGEYSFSYYELSRINQITYFSITPVPIRILRPSGLAGSASPDCNGATRPVVQPLISASPPSNPFLDPVFSLSTQNPATPTPPPAPRPNPVLSTTVQTRVITSSIAGVPVIVATTLTVVETSMPTPTGTAQVVMGTNEGDSGGDFPVLFAVNGQSSRLRLDTLGLVMPLSLIAWCCF